MHEEFIKYGTPPIKLIEECSELIKVICKGERFGYDDRNPLIENSKTNREKLYLEIADVELAITNFREWLDNLPEDNKRVLEKLKEYGFWCDKCHKGTVVEELNKEAAFEQLKQQGWLIDWGTRNAITVAIFTCSDCRKKENR